MKKSVKLKSIFLFLILITLGGEAHALSCQKIIGEKENKLVFIVSVFKEKVLRQKKIDVDEFKNAQSGYQELTKNELKKIKLSKDSSTEELLSYVEVVESRRNPNAPAWSVDQMNQMKKYVEKWKKKEMSKDSLEDLFLKLYLSKHFKISFKNIKSLIQEPRTNVKNFMQDFFWARLQSEGVFKSLVQMNFIAKDKPSLYARAKKSFVFKALHSMLFVGANATMINTYGVITLPSPQTQSLSKATTEKDFISFYGENFKKGALDLGTGLFRNLSQRLTLISVLPLIINPIMDYRDAPDFLYELATASKQEVVEQIVDIYAQDHMKLKGVELKPFQKNILESSFHERSKLSLLYEEYSESR